MATVEVQSAMIALTEKIPEENNMHESKEMQAPPAVVELDGDLNKEKAADLACEELVAQEFEAKVEIHMKRELVAAAEEAEEEEEAVTENTGEKTQEAAVILAPPVEVTAEANVAVETPVASEETKEKPTEEEAEEVPSENTAE